jgi:phosphatidylserine decarboxylase
MPIPHATNDFPIVKYADDTILIVPVDRNQILHLKGLLQAFANSTGLKVNFQVLHGPFKCSRCQVAEPCLSLWLTDCIHALHLLGSPYGNYQTSNGGSYSLDG